MNGHREKDMGRVLLITANVGSLFEDTRNLRTNWLNRIVQTIKSSNALFVALHMQEIGGKHFELHSREVPKVIRELYEMLQPDYNTALALLDLDFNAIVEYTALGSVFFVHRTAASAVQLYRFSKSKFKRLKSGLHLKQDLSACKKIRKEKFPREFWPAVRWGRKGYLHTRWCIGGHCLDLINIHLFHDENNLSFCENPQIYSGNRKKAMEFVLERYDAYCRAEENGKDAARKPLLFMFGDFNFRLNALSFLKKITEKTTQYNEECSPGDESPTCSCDDSDPSLRSNSSSYANLNGDQFIKRQLSAIEFRRGSKKTEDRPYVLRIEKKRFDFCEPSYLLTNWETFREDDQEPNAFPLRELRINFPPTYPWSEDPQAPNELMNTRSPAWCDRVLMNEAAWRLVSADSEHQYNALGMDICMGDHKPTYLSFALLAPAKATSR